MILSPQVEFRRQSAAVISSTVVVNIIWWMVMISAVGLGVAHLNHCPAKPTIPIFLIVLGAASLLSLSLTYIKNGWDDGAACILSSGCMTIMYIFTFLWFISGTTWVYSVYPPSYTPGEIRYCHRTIFLFAFVVTTLVWVIMALTLVCCCCFTVVTCCKTVRARHLLIPSRYSFYGGTSDFREPIASDV